MTHLNILKNLLPALTDSKRRECIEYGEKLGIKTTIDEFIIKRRSINRERHLELCIQRNEIKILSSLIKTEGMGRDEVKRQKELVSRGLLLLLLDRAISPQYEYLLINPDKRL